MKGRHNSVLSRIRNVQPEVLDIGCICHIFVARALSVPVGKLLIDVYFHFNHSAKHKEEYREFLKFCDVAPLILVWDKRIAMIVCVDLARQQRTEGVIAELRTRVRVDLSDH